ncbi:hypothetical protein CH259_24120 [Rhodococcus sp. 05-2254-4]|nr:hypothetical protein CH259_24120 [Rhodococcus sp. 05-2254-4]OZE41802.1 hypothetical protein CH261_23955 [Rhodococcus sp. 05-2254-3]OZE52237.1 hypothetical protein CH283_09220 [Rhodococcus sp. 05-2254-2]
MDLVGEVTDGYAPARVAGEDAQHRLPFGRTVAGDGDLCDLDLLPADTTQRNPPILLESTATASLRTRLRARGSIGFGRMTAMGSTRRIQSFP